MPFRRPAERRYSVAKDFSRFPAGRGKDDGPRSGLHLREEMSSLLREESVLVVDLDGTLGYGSSFLEAAFSGLCREGQVRVESAEDPSLVLEVMGYVRSPYSP